MFPGNLIPSLTEEKSNFTQKGFGIPFLIPYSKIPNGICGFGSELENTTPGSSMDSWNLLYCILVTYLMFFLFPLMLGSVYLAIVKNLAPFFSMLKAFLSSITHFCPFHDSLAINTVRPNQI